MTNSAWKTWERTHKGSNTGVQSRKMNRNSQTKKGQAECVLGN